MASYLAYKLNSHKFIVFTLDGLPKDPPGIPAIGSLEFYESGIKVQLDNSLVKKYMFSIALILLHGLIIASHWKSRWQVSTLCIIIMQ